MSATDELRRLLDERGVEYEIVPEDMYGSREYIKIGGIEILTNGCDEVAVFYLTPEQAVEATLGRGECTDTGRYCFTCSECGWTANEPHHAFGGFLPNYCPNCGRKVVDA